MVTGVPSVSKSNHGGPFGIQEQSWGSFGSNNVIIPFFLKMFFFSKVLVLSFVDNVFIWLKGSVNEHCFRKFKERKNISFYVSHNVK